MLKYLNHTFIALFPKRDNSNSVDHLRPIFLCNVVYKVITKMLFDRLHRFLDQIVFPFQSAVILGRCLFDSVTICHKIMHHINIKKGNLKLMAVKIDIAKAYDRVELTLLEKILFLHGFPPKFIYLIMDCVSSSSLSILINGSSFGFFKPTRGLRQGDPLSSFLFTLYIDLFSRVNDD